MPNTVLIGAILGTTIFFHVVLAIRMVTGLVRIRKDK